MSIEVQILCILTFFFWCIRDLVGHAETKEIQNYRFVWGCESQNVYVFSYACNIMTFVADIQGFAFKICEKQFMLTSARDRGIEKGTLW